MELERTYTIMLVEDDEKIASILTAELQRFGYLVVQAADYGRIKEEFVRLRPDLVLLDINLPRYDGYYWCRQIRTLSRLPILFISARSDDLDQVRAIENGADDYITKPFNLELVLAKIKGAIRRAYGEYAVGQESDLLGLPGLLLNRSSNRVSAGELSVELSPKEFRLLWALAQRPGEIITREELLEALWDDMEFVDDNTLTVNVTRVRRRLEELGLVGAIETKRGQGYRLSLDKG